MRKFHVLMVMFLLTGCAGMTKHGDQTGEQLGSDESVYWVNSWQRACQGVGERMCLQLQKVNQDNQQKPDIESWQLFYAAIEGFDYELGHVYKIQVKETKLPPAQVPADASSIHYELMGVIDKSSDDTLRLYDIWALTELNGQNIVSLTEQNSRQQRPSLEFNLSQMQVFGTDSCNALSGQIKALGHGHIKFGVLASTLMACPDMKLADDFTQAMYKVAHYELKGLTLRLLDSDKKTLLEFKKVD